TAGEYSVAGTAGVVTIVGVNYGVTCEDQARRCNSGTKTKTFEENYYLLLYVVVHDTDLAESNSSEYDQIYEINEHIKEEEVIEKMAETMEQYMSKTRENYGSGVARPTINQDTPFELKGQFLKELRDNTFSGLEHEDANEHIEKVAKKPTSGSITTCEVLKTKFLNKYCPPARTTKKMEEINNFRQEPDESLFHAWERFKELLMKCPQHYLTDMQEVILFYNGLDVPTRQILDLKGAIPSKTTADAKVAIQEMAEYFQKWHNIISSKARSTETSNGLATIQAQLNNLRREIKKVNEKVYAAQFGEPYQPGGQYRAAGPGFYQRNHENSSHEENSNIIKEIRASTDAAIRNQGASIKTLELQIGQISKVLQERGFESLPSSTEMNPTEQVKSISVSLNILRLTISPETCWLRNLLRELHTPLSSATLVYCDNVSAVYLSCNPVQHQRTKHIEIDMYFVRDLVAARQVRVLHVPSHYQFADIFTKGLPSALFEEFRSSLSIRYPPAPTAREC
ncbi:zf-CCHC domain-containing protein, partial [Tanacetum coccineum]